MRISFIGLGIMGSAMAANLLKSNHEITVWNRSSGKADELIKKGARLAGSLQDSVKNADIIFTMLSNPDVIETVALGPEGFLNYALENTLWVNTSTVNPSFALRMEEKAIQSKLRYLDAPVSGSKVPAEKGELIFLIGGDQNNMEQALPLLNLMGKNIHYLGNTGKGSAMKMVVNLLLAQAILAFSEAISLGFSSGLSEKSMFDILLGGPIVPAFLLGKRNKFESGNYSPEFPLKLVHKDLHLISQTAYENEVPMPLASAAKEMYALAKADGKGDEDIAAIYSFVQNIIKKENKF